MVEGDIFYDKTGEKMTEIDNISCRPLPHLPGSLRPSEVEMEADRADGGYEDDDGDDDTHHDGQQRVGLPGILGPHPATGIIR